MIETTSLKRSYSQIILSSGSFFDFRAFIFMHCHSYLTSRKCQVAKRFFLTATIFRSNFENSLLLCWRFFFILVPNFKNSWLLCEGHFLYRTQSCKFLMVTSRIFSNLKILKFLFLDPILEILDFYAGYHISFYFRTQFWKCLTFIRKIFLSLYLIVKKSLTIDC